jgi:NAD(P)-dependent dehydrogenase (short-subunit alcohol dehydrogenase family)
MWDGEPIGMLVLNAGAQFLNTSARSADGFELAFAVNHLAHYLPARLLLPVMAEGEREITTIAYLPGLTGGTGLSRAFPGPLRQVMNALRPVFILLSRLRPVHARARRIDGG